MIYNEYGRIVQLYKWDVQACGTDAQVNGMIARGYRRDAHANEADDHLRRSIDRFYGAIVHIYKSAAQGMDEEFLCVLCG